MNNNKNMNKNMNKNKNKNMNKKIKKLRSDKRMRGSELACTHQ